MVDNTGMRELFEAIKANGQNVVDADERIGRVEDDLGKIHQKMELLANRFEQLMKKVDDNSQSVVCASLESFDLDGFRRSSHLDVDARQMFDEKPKSQTGILLSTSLSPVPNEFHGIDPREWIYQANLYFKNSVEEWNTFEKVKYASYFMFGPAETWFVETFTTEPKENWECFCEKVLDRFTNGFGNVDENVEFMTPNKKGGFEDIEEFKTVEDMPMSNVNEKQFLHSNIAPRAMSRVGLACGNVVRITTGVNLDDYSKESVEVQTGKQLLDICRVVNGTWQTSGGWGRIERDKAMDAMIQYASVGSNWASGYQGKQNEKEPFVERRRLSTPPEKKTIRTAKPLELETELNVAQEDLKKAKENLALVENEKAQALDELKEAQNFAQEAMLAQMRAEEDSESVTQVFRMEEKYFRNYILVDREKIWNPGITAAQLTSAINICSKSRRLSLLDCDNASLERDYIKLFTIETKMESIVHHEVEFDCLMEIPYCVCEGCLLVVVQINHAIKNAWMGFHSLGVATRRTSLSRFVEANKRGFESYFGTHTIINIIHEFVHDSWFLCFIRNVAIFQFSFSEILEKSELSSDWEFVMFSKTWKSNSRYLQHKTPQLVELVGDSKDVVELMSIAPNIVNGTAAHEKPADRVQLLRELKESVEEIKVLVDDRSSELQYAKEENHNLSKQLQELQNEFKEGNHMHTSSPFSSLNEQFEHWNTEAEGYRTLAGIYKKKVMLEPSTMRFVRVGVKEQPPLSSMAAPSVYVMIKPDWKLYIGETDYLEGQNASFIYFMVPGKSMACQQETHLKNQLPTSCFILTNIAELRALIRTMLSIAGELQNMTRSKGTLLQKHDKQELYEEKRSRTLLLSNRIWDPGGNFSWCANT